MKKSVNCIYSFKANKIILALKYFKILSVLDNLNSFIETYKYIPINTLLYKTKKYF